MLGVWRIIEKKTIQRESSCGDRSPLSTTENRDTCLPVGFGHIPNRSPNNKHRHQLEEDGHFLPRQKKRTEEGFWHYSRKRCGQSSSDNSPDTIPCRSSSFWRKRLECTLGRLPVGDQTDGEKKNRIKAKWIVFHNTYKQLDWILLEDDGKQTGISNTKLENKIVIKDQSVREPRRWR